MSGVNKAIVIGNLGRDPEVRDTTAGKKVCTLSVATSESWRDKATGERKERTEWHRVVIFNENLVNVANQYLKKGSRVYIEGAMHTRKWQDQQGVDRYTTEIVLNQFHCQLVLLDKREGGGGPSSPDSPDDYGTQPKASAAPAQRQTTLAEELDDEIPF